MTAGTLYVRGCWAKDRNTPQLNGGAHTHLACENLEKTANSDRPHPCPDTTSSNWILNSWHHCLLVDRTNNTHSWIQNNNWATSWLFVHWWHDDYANTNLLAMFHSKAGFWELLSLSAETPPLVPSFSGLSCSQWAVPMLMDWRSIWYWRSSISDPGSCRMPRLKARLETIIGKGESLNTIKEKKKSQPVTVIG